MKQRSGMLRNKLETVKKLASCYLGGSYSHFVEFARNMFEDIHHNSILGLLNAFPVDHKLENGGLFWSGPKRPPAALKFDLNDE
jgi:ubiquitin-activating enzyme E1